MPRLKLITLATTVLVAVALSSDRAAAYTTTDSMRPSNLWIQLVLNSAPIHDNFTRYLTFTNRAGATKSVAVDFVKDSALHYSGTASAAGLATLRTLADENNRSYWDSMKFENKGGTTALDINQMFAQVEYDGTCCNREEIAPIIYITNKVLAAGNDSFTVPGIGGSGRINHAQDYLGITYNELMSYPLAFRYFVYDIGKSGSSDGTDSTSSSNHKYGLTGGSLCSETISWYYHEYGVRITQQAAPHTVYDFRDITAHTQLHDQFLAAGRLYCYHSGQSAWVKKDASYNWMLGVTYVPRPGDYLDRRDSDGDPSNGDDGHAMMIAGWNAASGVATTLDGPWNINFRPEPVAAEENAGSHDYCIGRIPAND
jgi:hypothetical protein